MLRTNLERRNYHRMLIDSPVQVTDGSKNITAICRDLSASGMSLDLPELYFQLGDNVNIFLPTGDARVPPLQAEATVTRVDNEDEETFQIGVEFTSLD